MEKDNNLKILIEKIEDKKRHLDELLLVKPINSLEVSELSIELDKLVIEYYQTSAILKQNL